MWQTSICANRYMEKEIYDETIDLKCLKCYYEEQDIDWKQIKRYGIKIIIPKFIVLNVASLNLSQLIYGKRNINIKNNILKVNIKLPVLVEKILKSRIFTIIYG